MAKLTKCPGMFITTATVHCAAFAFSKCLHRISTGVFYKAVVGLNHNQRALVKPFDNKQAFQIRKKRECIRIQTR